MSWRDSALSLCRSLGPNAKAAVTTALTAMLPARPDVVLLVEHALGCVQPASRRTWKLRKNAWVEAGAADQERLGQLFSFLGGSFRGLLEEVASGESAGSLLEEAMSPSSLRPALKRLRAIARPFGRYRLEERRFLVAPAAEQFLSLPVAEGLRFGCWSLWVVEEGIGLLVAHAPTGTLLRIWLGCNGWFEYRNHHLIADRIFTVWSAGNRSVDPPGRYLDSLDQRGPPGWRLPDGTFAAEQWVIEAGPTLMTLRHPMTARELTFERARPVWGCNDVRWNEP
jgi:hypothetical protein